MDNDAIRRWIVSTFFITTTTTTTTTTAATATTATKYLAVSTSLLVPRCRRSYTAVLDCINIITIYKDFGIVIARYS